MASGVLEVPVTANVESRAGKYLTFALGEQEYAVQVLCVREIASMQEITAVPHTPGYVRGVVNLRGKVIPVIDLRLKFGLPEQEYTPRTSIVVVEIERDRTRILAGIIVDKVSEVLAFQTADIEDTPDFGDGATTPYILGIAKTKGRMKILLDINMVLSAQQL
jgi:purine-binding chemotaxis protein CheW